MPSSTTRPITARPLPPSRTWVVWPGFTSTGIMPAPLASQGRVQNAGDVTAAGNHPINREPPLRIGREVIVVAPHSEGITAIRGQLRQIDDGLVGSRLAADPHLAFDSSPGLQDKLSGLRELIRCRVGEPRIGRDDEQEPPLMFRDREPAVRSGGGLSAFEFSWTTPPRTNARFSCVPRDNLDPSGGSGRREGARLRRSPRRASSGSPGSSRLRPSGRLRDSAGS